LRYTLSVTGRFRGLRRFSVPMLLTGPNRLGTEYPIIQGPLGGLPSHRFLMKSLSGVAEKAERPDLFPMWAGQSANLSRHRDATTILRSLVSDDLAERLNRGETVAFPGGMTANSAASANLAASYWERKRKRIRLGAHPTKAQVPGSLLGHLHSGRGVRDSIPVVTCAHVTPIHSWRVRSAAARRRNVG
jgi:hypothetical protein